MSEELDRRAALAMGWRIETDSVGWEWGIDKGGTRWPLENWSPSTDRNDLAELLREVEQRGMVLRFAMKVDGAWIDSGGNLPRYIVWLLTADPAIVCLAAVETLEAANG